MSDEWEIERVVGEKGVAPDRLLALVIPSGGVFHPAEGSRAEHLRMFARMR
jgi:hypothetical protein